MPTKGKFISLQEAADYYGVSVKSIRRWISDGRLEAFRTGPRLLRVRVDGLDKAARKIPTA